MNRKPYNADVSDEEWKILKPLIPAVQPSGRPRFRNIAKLLTQYSTFNTLAELGA